MRRISKPELHVEAIVNCCAATLQNDDLKARILSSLHELVAFEASYGNLAEQISLYTIPEATHVCEVTALEMKNLYDRTFVRKSGPTRDLYDKLILSANGICPLCQQRTVSTLDHHLPKAYHPAFAVTPINLVPACKDCNTDSGSRRPQLSTEQSIHPYFHDVNDDVWLFARVIEVSPPVVEFYTSPPNDWPLSKQEIVTRHFIDFKLASLYSIHAAAELINVFTDIEISQDFTYEGIRNFLLKKAQGRRRFVKNNWQAAMYQAVADSEWFCTGGYREIVLG